MSRIPLARAALLALVLALPSVAGAQQQSESYKFLQAVRDAKNDDVKQMLSKPGTTVLNTHDYSTGEGALHIVVKRGDADYLKFLLGQDGIDPNIRDHDGVTPLELAARLGEAGLADILLNNAWHKANPNIADDNGQTPLILAVQHHNLELVRILIKAGANPDQSDHLAGMSARDYARQDTRMPALLKLIDDAPKKAGAAVAGPKF